MHKFTIQLFETHCIGHSTLTLHLEPLAMPAYLFFEPTLSLKCQVNLAWLKCLAIVKLI